MPTQRRSLLFVFVVAVFALLPASLRAQVGADLLVKTWGEGAAIETTDSAMLEAQGHSKDDDIAYRLSTYHAEARWRVFPDNDATPRLGTDVQYWDVDTHDPAVPRHLFNGQIGFAQPIAEYQKWFVALTGSVGYAGESPFSDPRAVYETGQIVVGRKFSADKAVIVALDYDGNRNFAPDIPIPGFAYADRINDQFTYIFGLPYSSITYEPVHGLQLEAGYLLVRTFEAKVSYQFDKHWAAYTEYNDQLTGFHIDNTSPDRRLFLQTHDIETGIRWTLKPGIRFSVGGGWAFGQEFFTAFDLRGTNPLQHLTDEAFGKVQLEFTY